MWFWCLLYPYHHPSDGSRQVFVASEEMFFGLFYVTPFCLVFCTVCLKTLALLYSSSNQDLETGGINVIKLLILFNNPFILDYAANTFLHAN